MSRPRAFRQAKRCRFNLAAGIISNGAAMNEVMNTEVKEAVPGKWRPRARASSLDTYTTAIANKKQSPDNVCFLMTSRLQ
jgi:hypothetical protein